MLQGGKAELSGPGLAQSQQEQHVVLMFNRNSIYVLSYDLTPKCKSNKDQGDQLKASPR